MKANDKDQRGVTLVEVLVVFVLLSLILLLLNSVHLFGQRQFIDQEKNIENQESLQYAMKYVTKEIRKYNNGNRDEKTKGLVINKDSGTDIYFAKDNNLYKNNDIILSGITHFEVLSFVNKGEKPNKLRIIIEGLKNANDSAKIETELYLRDGSDSYQKR